MREIRNWVERVREILAFISAQRIPYAEITLTVKGGKVAFVDYRGPIKCEETEDENAVRKLRRFEL